MADNTVVYTGTGRRKEAVARVRLVPGTGKIVVNGRDAAQYFGRQQLVDNAAAPLRLTETAESFDVLARCDGGGINGQSGALRLAPALFSRLASTARSSRRLASSPVTPVPSSARSTVSRRPASARSSRSARVFSSLCPLSGPASVRVPIFCVRTPLPCWSLGPSSPSGPPGSLSPPPPPPSFFIGFCENPRSLSVSVKSASGQQGKRRVRFTDTDKERGEGRPGRHAVHENRGCRSKFGASLSITPRVPFPYLRLRKKLGPSYSAIRPKWTGNGPATLASHVARPVLYRYP